MQIRSLPFTQAVETEQLTAVHVFKTVSAQGSIRARSLPKDHQEGLWPVVSRELGPWQRRAAWRPTVILARTSLGSECGAGRIFPASWYPL